MQYEFETLKIRIVKIQGVFLEDNNSYYFFAVKFKIAALMLSDGYTLKLADIYCGIMLVNEGMHWRNSLEFYSAETKKIANRKEYPLSFSDFCFKRLKFKL